MPSFIRNWSDKAGGRRLGAQVHGGFYTVITSNTCLKIQD